MAVDPSCFVEGRCRDACRSCSVRRSRGVAVPAYLQHRSERSAHVQARWPRLDHCLTRIAPLLIFLPNSLLWCRWWFRLAVGRCDVHVRLFQSTSHAEVRRTDCRELLQVGNLDRMAKHRLLRGLVASSHASQRAHSMNSTQPSAHRRARWVRPNPSLKRSANGRPPGPGLWYSVHFHRPGPGVLPLSPA